MINHKKTFLSLTFLLYVVLASGRVFFIAPDGHDTNAGDIENPLESITRAQQLISPGDTVFVRGGKYDMRTDQIAEYKDIWAYVTTLDKSGLDGSPINYWAYPGEKPVFDYSTIKPADKRIIAFYVTGSWLHIKGIEITGVQVTITTHTQSECFEVRGSNNIFEQINMHDGMAIGIYILRGSNNLILNCDAYNNYDSVSEGGAGGNVDGFGCHAPSGHVNNVFRGCRAWFNSDDGYDCISSGEPVLFDHCWAFYNGYSVGFVSRGDGNGIKAGGYGSTAYSKLPYPIPSNTIQFCLAVRNKQSGFYSNHHLAGSTWTNNTAYLNKRNYNMLNREARTVSGYLIDVPGWGHKMRNNLGYKASYLELSDINKPACDLSHNYFDLDLVITDSDFLSLDLSALTAPRDADGSLPVSDFLQLKEGSDLIDKGVESGFPFNGLAPDLGCFETEYTNAIPTTVAGNNMTVKVYPNPFNGEVTMTFSLTEYSDITISLFNLRGQKIKTLSQQSLSHGDHSILFDGGDIPSGNYILTTQVGNLIMHHQVITAL